MSLFECPSVLPDGLPRGFTNDAIVCATPIYPQQTVLTFEKSRRFIQSRDLNERFIPGTPVLTQIEMEEKKPYYGKFRLYNLNEIMSHIIYYY